MNTSSITPTPPPCPPWCGLPAGHPYDDENRPGEPIRTHRLVLAQKPSRFTGPDYEDRITIEALAELLPDGTEQVWPPAVEGQVDGDQILTSRLESGAGLSPAELRRLGKFLRRGLVLAATRLEAIERGQA
jgi:hypothetical protein